VLSSLQVFRPTPRTHVSTIPCALHVPPAPFTLQLTTLTIFGAEYKNVCNLSAVPCCFNLLRSKYSHQHPVPNYSQTLFVHARGGPSCKHTALVSPTHRCTRLENFWENIRRAGRLKYCYRKVFFLVLKTSLFFIFICWTRYSMCADPIEIQTVRNCVSLLFIKYLLHHRPFKKVPGIYLFCTMYQLLVYIQVPQRDLKIFKSI
jgi:hypothetical protein